MCRPHPCSAGTDTKPTSMQALQFAVDQAPFACETTSNPAANTAECKREVGGTSDVRLAVRASLQFAYNYCAGGEESKASLWAVWFPRGLMVRYVRAFLSFSFDG